MNTYTITDLLNAVARMEHQAYQANGNPKAPRRARDFNAGRYDAYKHVRELIESHMADALTRDMEEPFQ